MYRLNIAEYHTDMELNRCRLRRLTEFCRPTSAPIYGMVVQYNTIVEGS